MINPNQRIVGPFGDIYTPNTTATDKLSAQLYAEQKAKEAQDAKDAKELDDEFAKNIAGVKNADIPDLTKAWNDFKMAKIGVLKKGGNATPQDEFNVLQKKADVFRLAIASKEDKAWILSQQTAKRNDKQGLYSDDADAKLTQYLNTPTSKRDRIKDGEILYPYSVPDWNKIHLASAGTKKVVYGKTTEDGIYDVTPQYEVYNSPNQRFDAIVLPTVSVNKVKNTVGLINSQFPTEQDKQNVLDQYNAKIKTPEFIAAYGEVKPLITSANPTELEKAAALQVAKDVVDEPIPTAKVISKVNYNRANAVRFGQQLKMENIRYKHGMNKIALMNQGKQYEIDDVPGKLRSSAQVMPFVADDNGNIREGSILNPVKSGGVSVVDVTNWPQEEIDDVLGKQKDSHGRRLVQPFTIKGKSYLREYPDGFGAFNTSTQTPVKLGNDGVITNTFTRQHIKNKEVGTGKAFINKVDVSQTKKGKYD